MLNLATVLEDGARAAPERAAVIYRSRTISYPQLDTAANRVANLLRARGIVRGDRVALSCPNLPDFAAVYFGILKVGAVVVPLDVDLGAEAIARRLAASGARAYFCFEGTPDLPVGENGWAAYRSIPGCVEFVLITADPIADSPIAGARTLAGETVGRPDTFETVQTDPDDPAVLVVEGAARASQSVVSASIVSHGAITLNVLTIMRLFVDRRHDVQLVALPLSSMVAQTLHLHLALTARDTLVLLPRFDPRAALSLMAERDVRMFAGTPTMFWALLGCPLEASKIARALRLAICTDGVLAPEINRSFARRFGVSAVEAHGFADTGPLLALRTDDARAREPYVVSRAEAVVR